MSMEDIIKINALARASGLTYGEYQKAHPKTIEPAPKKRRYRCVFCGGPVYKRAKYCSPQCGNAAWKRRRQDELQRNKDAG